MKKQCPLCCKNVCNSCFKKEIRLENPIYEHDEDQQEFIDINVCEHCANSVQSLKKYLDFKKNVELANEKSPLLIIQKQISKQREAIKESMDTLRLFIEDFGSKGGATNKQYNNAILARETVQKLFTALEKCKKQLMRDFKVTVSSKIVLTNMRVGLKQFLEKALPLYKELNDQFLQIKIIEPKKKKVEEPKQEKKGKIKLKK